MVCLLYSTSHEYAENHRPFPIPSSLPFSLPSFHGTSDHTHSFSMVSGPLLARRFCSPGFSSALHRPAPVNAYTLASDVRRSVAREKFEHSSTFVKRPTEACEESKVSQTTEFHRIKRDGTYIRGGHQAHLLGYSLRPCRSLLGPLGETWESLLRQVRFCMSFRLLLLQRTTNVQASAAMKL